MPLVKICGNTSIEDARFSSEAGADFIGAVVEHAPSPRSIPLAKAVELARAVHRPFVAVTVNQPLERLLEMHVSLAAVADDVIFQLHGDEPADLIRQLVDKSIRVWGVAAGDADTVRARTSDLRAAGVEAILLDVRENTPEGVIYGGTGKLGDWNLARELVDHGYRIVLAGGLTPENVGRAVEAVRPQLVDVVSGVEAQKGVKDRDKVRAFVRNARN